MDVPPFAEVGFCFFEPTDLTYLSGICSTYHCPAMGVPPADSDAVPTALLDTKSNKIYFDCLNSFYRLLLKDLELFFKPDFQLFDCFHMYLDTHDLKIQQGQTAGHVTSQPICPCDIIFSVVSASSFVHLFPLSHRITLYFASTTNIYLKFPSESTAIVLPTPLFELIVFETGVQATMLTRGVILDNNRRNSISWVPLHTFVICHVLYLHIHRRAISGTSSNYVYVQCVSHLTIQRKYLVHINI